MKQLALGEEQTDLTGFKSVLALVCEQTREHSGKGSFLQKHKILPSQRQRLVVYDSGLPSGRVIMNSVKAANHSLQIQKQKLIQGKKHAFPYMLVHVISKNREAMGPNSCCSSCGLLLWTHILQEH